MNINNVISFVVTTYLFKIELQRIEKLKNISHKNKKTTKKNFILGI